MTMMMWRQVESFVLTSRAAAQLESTFILSNFQGIEAYITEVRSLREYGKVDTFRSQNALSDIRATNPL